MSSVKSEVDKNLFVILRNTQNDAVDLVASPSNFQVGLNNSPSDLTLLGRLSLSSKVYFATQNNGYSVRLDNNVSIALVSVAIRNSAKVFLPENPREGQIIFIKDRDGVCSIASMVIMTTNNVLIDGSTTSTINSDYGKKCFCWNVDRWSTLIS